MTLRDRLRGPQAWFMACTALYTLVFTALVILVKYESSREDAIRKLRCADANLNQMKETTAEMKTAVAYLQSLLSTGVGTRSPERLMFARVDDIRSSMTNAHISVGGVEEKETEYTLPFSIRCVNANYSGFLNSIGRLQSLAFPFVVFDSILIAPTVEEGETAVSFVVEGRVQMPNGSTSTGDGS